MSHLQETIARLATEFANSVLHAIRSAPLSEIMPTGAVAAPKAAAAREAVRAPVRATPARAAAPASAASSRRGGRTSGVDIDKSLVELLALLGKSRNGAQGGELRKDLRLSKGQFLRVAAAGVHSKKIRRIGERRGIKYFLV